MHFTTVCTSLLCAYKVYDIYRCIYWDLTMHSLLYLSSSLSVSLSSHAVFKCRYAFLLFTRILSRLPLNAGRQAHKDTHTHTKTNTYTYKLILIHTHFFCHSHTHTQTTYPFVAIFTALLRRFSASQIAFPLLVTSTRPRLLPAPTQTPCLCTLLNQAHNVLVSMCVCVFGSL